MEREYTVFVVDDASVNRRILESALEKTYVVESFGGAAECLERLQKKIPDLFLLDVDMPEIDGFEFLKRVKSQLKRPVNVVMVTARKTMQDVVMAKELGVCGYITKPFDPERLVKIVEMFSVNITVI